MFLPWQTSGPLCYESFSVTPLLCECCFVFFGKRGMGQKPRAPLISTCENPYIIHARVRLMRARIVWLGAACPPGETLALLPCRVQPFMLARSGGGGSQKETSAHWENALIIHDHLTIQDLVWAAYVAFHISAATGQDCRTCLHFFFLVTLIVVLSVMSLQNATKTIIVLLAAMSWLIIPDGNMKGHNAAFYHPAVFVFDVSLLVLFVFFLYFAKVLDVYSWNDDVTLAIVCLADVQEKSSAGDFTQIIITSDFTLLTFFCCFSYWHVWFLMSALFYFWLLSSSSQQNPIIA